MSGINMAKRLLDSGFTNFTIYEKDPRGLGGTWRQNTYPGCACDIPAPLYAYSFASDFEWTRIHAKQPELLRYVESVVRRFKIGEHARVGVAVESAEWSERRQVWTVRLSDGTADTANVLVNAVGGLHFPSFPTVPGAARRVGDAGAFAGPSWHTAAWDGAASVAGKRVGVIGSAASAIQAVPEMAKEAAQITMFQRTPNWILDWTADYRSQTGNEQGVYSKSKREGFGASHGLWIALERMKIYLRLEVWFAACFGKNSRAGALMEQDITAHAAEVLTSKETAERLTPDFRIGCKRVLGSAYFHTALNRDNVHLCTSPVKEVVESGVVDGAGRTHNFDVLVYATGFKPLDLGPLTVTGVEGRSLRDVWGQAPRTYLGISTPGFPNMFTLLGPSTALGHNSVVWMVECQVNYVIDCLEAMDRDGIGAVDVRSDVVDAQMAWVDRCMSKMVWTSGCKAWYQNAAGGVYALWPASTMRYWWETLSWDAKKYHTDGPAAAAGAAKL
eukprot:TRINITY_DN516_c4_g1_i1.p1 TRINITY_DN516_c4_g1~~TRINITY_DN516_c4_g1_i1.p1  ORF type:complete len:574 (+),score=163.00 TRINITY_DN516_c4_g1_i1:219-1724(+)